MVVVRFGFFGGVLFYAGFFVIGFYKFFVGISFN